MENYFWVAVQSHCFADDKEVKLNGQSIVDVLALAGPNTKGSEVGGKRVTCLVKAVVSRGFEIALLVERQTTVPLEGRWTSTAESLIGDLPQSSCEISPCPLEGGQGIKETFDSNFCLSHRIPVDVSECSSEDVDVLRWALADMKRPLTALGRAWGTGMYALIGAPECVSTATKSIPDDIWHRILALLVRLGINDLTNRLERAAVFVWDLVDCLVHRGFGDATVIDLAKEYCACPICAEPPRQEALETTGLDKAIEAVSVSLPNEFIHKWWNCKETASFSGDLKLPSWFKLRLRTTGTEVLLPTLDSLKQKTVQILAHLEDFRVLVGNHMREAGISHHDMERLPQKILQREMERSVMHNSSTTVSVANQLLSINQSGASPDLVWRLNALGTSPARKTLDKAHVRYLVRDEFCRYGSWWPRITWLSGLNPPQAALKSVYRLTPCRLFTVPAVDTPGLFRQSCSTCSIANCNDHQYSEATLSTCGQYGKAVWNLYTPKFSRQLV